MDEPLESWRFDILHPHLSHVPVCQGSEEHCLEHWRCDGQHEFVSLEHWNYDHLTEKLESLPEQWIHQPRRRRRLCRFADHRTYQPELATNTLPDNIVISDIILHHNAHLSPVIPVTVAGLHTIVHGSHADINHLTQTIIRSETQSHYITKSRIINNNTATSPTKCRPSSSKHRITTTLSMRSEAALN